MAGAVASRLPAGERMLLSGWGRTSPTTAVVMRPRGAEQVALALRSDTARRGGLIARGSGRSYGDAACNGGGVVLDLTGLKAIDVSVSPEPLLRAGAGATLAEMMTALAPHDLSLPVVPGTRHITLGGAIAADIHGKNHRRDGSFGRHVSEIELVSPDGEIRRISRRREADLFHATLGGMGLTGVIVAASLVPSSQGSAVLDADIDRLDDLESALSTMRDDTGYRYSIAWVDLLSGGKRFGRSVVMRSNERSKGVGDVAKMPGRPRLTVPTWFPEQVLSRPLVQAFNTLRWRRAPVRGRGVDVRAGDHFFPLDALGQWSRLYGARGLLQHQLVVPEDRGEVLIEAVESMRAAGLPLYLAVVKRFGEGSGGLLSFPRPGWTLAVDMPASAPRLRETLDAIDERVAAAGGRVYLAKDSRLRGDLMETMYPQLGRFREVRRKVDPEGLMQSDQSRRLGIDGVGGVA